MRELTFQRRTEWTSCMLLHYGARHGGGVSSLL